MSAIARAYDSSSAFDLTALRYVRAIAASGSMTAAARQLQVSQPTLSVAVADLEARLGTVLFLRGPRGVTTTAAGQLLLGAIDELFALLHQTDARIRGLQTIETGRFVIGCYHSLGAYFLPELMRAMAARAPAIELALWNGTADEVRDAAVERTIHFGIAVAPRPHPELVLVPLFRDVMTVMTAARRTRARRDAPLFYVPRIRSCMKVIDALRARDALPGELVACGDLELVKSLAANGAGAGVLPWRVASYNLPAGRLRPVEPRPAFEVDVAHLVYRADLHRTLGALRVRDELVARGRALDGVALPCGVARLARSARPG